MRFIKIQQQAVATLRVKLGITQQELAARVGCSLSAVQFWEAGRSSPRGYRLRHLIDLCPDAETRALFISGDASKRAPVTDAKTRGAVGQTESDRRYLNPELLHSLPAEARALYQGAIKNILELTSMKMRGNQVAAEGLRLLAETITQIVGMPTPPPAAPSAGTTGHPPAPDKPKDRDS